MNKHRVIISVIRYVGVAMLVSITDALNSLGEISWANIHWNDKIILFLAPLVAGLNALGAVMNTSIASPTTNTTPVVDKK